MFAFSLLWIARGLVSKQKLSATAPVPAALPGLHHSVKATQSLPLSRQRSSSSVNMAKANKTAPSEIETPLHRAPWQPAGVNEEALMIVLLGVCGDSLF